MSAQNTQETVASAVDPLIEHDPWLPFEPPNAAHDAPAGFGLAPDEAPVYSQVSVVEPPAQRIIHDVPPVWDGKDPDNQAEPYLKLLSGWLSTTRTLKTQRAMTILYYAAGDLKLIINELDVEVLLDRQPLIPLLASLRDPGGEM